MSKGTNHPCWRINPLFQKRTPHSPFKTVTVATPTTVNSHTIMANYNILMLISQHSPPVLLILLAFVRKTVSVGNSCPRFLSGATNRFLSQNRKLIDRISYQPAAQRPLLCQSYRNCIQLFPAEALAPQFESQPHQWCGPAHTEEYWRMASAPFERNGR